MHYCIKIFKGSTERLLFPNKKPEVKSIFDVYYRVEGSTFLLLLKEFTSIQANGNPVRIILTIAILPMAIAKLDWIVAIFSAPLIVYTNK